MKYIISIAEAAFILHIEPNNRFRTKLLQSYKTKRKLYTSPLCAISIVETDQNRPISIHITGKKTGVVILGKRKRNVTYHVVDFFLLSLLQIFCAKQNIYILHGSSIVKDEKGYVFLGPPDAGKSTITHYVDQKSILSDDVSIIKKEKKDFYVYASSFDRRKQPGIQTTKKVLKSLYILKKSHMSKTQFILPMQARQKILSSSFLYMYTRKLIRGGKTQMLHIEQTFVFEWVDEIVKKIPVYRLYFQKNNEFLSLL